MDRIRLSRQEKKILRELKRGRSSVPDGMDNYTFFDAVVSLRDKRLVKGVTEYETDVHQLSLTAKGYAYLRDNPRLFNPINWTMIAIGAVVAAIAGIAGLFISCSLLK